MIRDNPSGRLNFALRLICAGTGIGLATGAQAALAQAAGDTEESLEKENVGVTDIIVTATRRSESLQNVPAAITAIQGDELQKLGVKDAFGIVSQTPNMFVDSANGARSAPRFNLRGVGTNDFTASAVPSVGVYFDDVFIASTYGQGVPLFDLDRVEVLRGPQGTLWGKNTTAGAVNILSRPPGGTLNGYARISYGNYNNREVEGALGGDIIDGKLAARLSFITAARDGLYRNVVTGAKGNSFEDTAARFQLQWDPSDTISARLILTARDEHEEQYFMMDGINADGSNFLGYKNPSRESFGSDVPSPIVNKTRGATLKVQADLGFADLASISSYFDNRFHARADLDASPLVFGGADYSINTHQMTQELRLTSPQSRSLRWILGAYYLFEHLENQNVVSFPNIPGFSTARLIQQDTSSAAIFANVEYDVFDKFTLIGGLRYTTERKSPNILVGSFDPSPTDPYNFNQGSNFSPFVDTSLKDTVRKFTWDLTARYQFNPAVQVYARAASGFKSANFNFAIFAPADVSVARPETLVSYEMGLKSTWFDRKLQVNLTGFYYDYKDYQIPVFVQGIALQYANAKKATVKGFEVEIVARPTNALTLRLSGGYSDAHFGDFPNASAPGEVNSGLPFDASGQRLPRSPRGTASALLRYEAPVGSGTFNFQTDWNYVGDVKFDTWTEASNLSAAPGYAASLGRMRSTLEQQGYLLGNARVGYRFADDRAELSLWVKNITDRYYKTNAYNFFSLGVTGFTRGDPRTFGATLEFRFGG